MRTRSAAAGLTLALVGWLLVATPAGAARAATPFDVNGDGYADLVTGVPGESFGKAQQAGAIEVVYGSKDGLRARGAQLWSRATAGVAGDPTEYEGLGRGVASADFDRDGYADVATLTCTQVLVVFGSARGLSTRHQELNPTIQKTECASFDDGLRAAVTGDFDGDGRTDLAVTASYPRRVWVFAGTANGLAAEPVSFSKTPRYPTGEKVEDVGTGLAAGDLDADGFDDLAVGIGLAQLDSDISGPGGFAGFFVVPGSRAGLRPDRKHFIAGFTTPGLAPRGGYVSGAFGNRLAIADLDRDGDGDLVVADPEGGTDKATCDYVCAGVVYLIPGSRNGISIRDRRYWDLSTRWAQNEDEDYPTGNNFGARLALGDLNRDGNIDLAIAAPYDQSNYGRPGLRKDYLNPGNVYVVYGTANGPESRARQVWSQRSPGVPGEANAWEGFGRGGLQILDVGRGRTADLLVHTPGDRGDRGSVTVLYGTRSGVTTRGAQLWHQDQPGIPDIGEGIDDGDRFGTL